MTATTPMPLGALKDHHPAPYYHFTTFTWNAHLFRSTCDMLKIKYECLEDEEYPYYSIFQFACDAPCLVMLIHRHVLASYPFSLGDFYPKQNTE